MQGYVKYVMPVMLAGMLVMNSEAQARNTQIMDYSREGQPQQDMSEWNGFVAAGGIILPEFDGSEDYQVIPALAGQLNKGNYYVALRGLQLMGNVVDSDRFNAGPMVQYRFGRDAADADNAVIRQLSSFDDAVEVGAFASWINRDVWRQGDNLELIAEVLQDVADGHGGTLGEVGATYFTPLTQQLRYSLSGFLNYQSDDYMNSYFSVSSEDAARSGLRQYSAGSGFNSYSIGNQLFYSFDRNWGITGLVSYTQLIADAADSPIVSDVGSEHQLLGVMAVTYRF